LKGCDTLFAEERLKNIIKNCQRALIKLEHNDKRRTVGLIDEIEEDAEAAKWMLINEILEVEGEF
jgi:DNA-binding ferritin-like protein